MIKYNESEPLLTISVVSRLAKLHTRTIMQYEKTLLIKPHRTASGRRLYSQLDIDKILFIHYLAEKKGVNLSGVKVILDIMDKNKGQDAEIKSKLFPDFQIES